MRTFLTQCISQDDSHDLRVSNITTRTDNVKLSEKGREINAYLIENVEEKPCNF